MCAQLIDGKLIAEQIRHEIKSEVEELKKIKADSKENVPGLAVIICGARKDSQTYVKLKHKAAVEVGFRSVNIELPETISQEELENKIEELNKDESWHGILLQLPLPAHINEFEAIEKITHVKDVDGLSIQNVGLLHSKGKEPLFLPCTPAGIIEVLERMNISIEKKRAVVLGRSNIVGAPVAALLMKKNATVTVVHSMTPTNALIESVQQADIVVSALGKPDFVKGEWIKQGAVVIDVGTTPVEDSSKKNGYRLAGDVQFNEASQRASFITPVPGGVGPMTIAMLLRNTLKSFKRSLIR